MIDPKVLRDDPDRVRAAQAKRGLSDEVVDRALAADAARRRRSRRSRPSAPSRRQLGKQIPQAQGEEKAGPAGADQGARGRGEGGRGRPDRGRGGLARGR